MSDGIPGLDRIAQVKLPVTDLAVSVPWYCRLLDLRLWVEIVEDGVLRGAGLIDRAGRFNVSLRDREVCASTPDLTGFDVVFGAVHEYDKIVRVADNSPPRQPFDPTSTTQIGCGHRPTRPPRLVQMRIEHRQSDIGQKR